MDSFLILLSLTFLIGMLAGVISYFTFSGKKREGKIRQFLLVGIAKSYFILACLYFTAHNFENSLGSSVGNWFKYLILNLVGTGYFTRIIFFVKNSRESRKAIF